MTETIDPTPQVSPTPTPAPAVAPKGRTKKSQGVAWRKISDKIDEFYDPSLPPTYSSQMIVEPYTTYTKDQLTGCQGP